ncbi:MAG TPA: hypothetical protein VM866_04485 [Pyrinomonadaceae bacterium]|jgi:hypothetical protein|nr:hypothetical protein [Pyrinomonadaceae bacterium]
MIEDKATEKLKKRAQDSGLIVNAGDGETQGTIASQTRTTRKLPEGFKQGADEEMAGGQEGGKE